MSTAPAQATAQLNQAVSQAAREVQDEATKPSPLEIAGWTLLAIGVALFIIGISFMFAREMPKSSGGTSKRSGSGSGAKRRM